VNNLKSRPYIDLTLQVLEHFGWKVENRNYQEFYFSGAGGGVSGDKSYVVEGDWSGGAFLLVAGALGGAVTVKGLDEASTQADKAILQALKDSGAEMTMGDRVLKIGPGALKAFRFDATDCPDLFPPLVALASYCAGTTMIDGVSRLAHKESNRGLTLQEEFGKMGVVVRLEGDRMHVEGGGGLKGAVVHSRHDHRIAMACAVAALRADGNVTIEEASAINKSYPDFYQHLQQLGADISINSILV
jgi:3-phosphoshikimate 1-carboxyvinyltransferase